VEAALQLKPWGWNDENKSPERAEQIRFAAFATSPFQGLISSPLDPRARALGFAAQRFQRSE
jgi:hypothetical protein